MEALWRFCFFLGGVGVVYLFLDVYRFAWTGHSSASGWSGIFTTYLGRTG